MLAARRRHKDPCFANGRSVISPLLPRDESSRPSPTRRRSIDAFHDRAAGAARRDPGLAGGATLGLGDRQHRPKSAPPRAKASTYLKGPAAKASGEIPGFGGDWSLTSLAAAGIAPADVNKAGKTGNDARSWYESVVGAPTWPGEGAARDRLRARRAARLRRRDRPGPRLQTAEPDRQGRLLLPAGKPGLLRLDLQRDRLRPAGARPR